MKGITLLISVVFFLSCGQQKSKPLSDHGSIGMAAGAVDTNTYVTIPGESPQDEIVDSLFMMGTEDYSVTIKSYVVGDPVIADTSENRIFLYKDRRVDITINGKTTTIDKSKFAHVYPDKNQLYHSGFGSTVIDTIDKSRKKIVFSTFCGFHQSDYGELLYYALTPDGKYEFIRTEIPEEGE
ncbi:MAG: hypothetical protein JST26_08095 [Bacteroidetes bacterium]|nr:hypothetical protein [Bacteroidota bacterium]